MSIRRALGLEKFPITDEEVVEKIRNAMRDGLREVEFNSTAGPVRVRLRSVEPRGIMREFEYLEAR